MFMVSLGKSQLEIIWHEMSHSNGVKSWKQSPLLFLAPFVQRLVSLISVIQTSLFNVSL